MADTTTGANRLLGETTMRRISELRRQAVVAQSEMDGSVPASAADFPTLVAILRRERSVAGDSRVGIAGTWSIVAGLGDLTGRVRSSGEWHKRGTEIRTPLGEADRIVSILDVPAAGAAAIDEVLITDRLQFDDPNYGQKQIWQITELRASSRDGVVIALVTLSREEAA